MSLYIYIYFKRWVQVTPGVTLKRYTFFKPLDLSRSNGQKKTLINVNIQIKISFIISYLWHSILISKIKDSLLSLFPPSLFHLHCHREIIHNARCNFFGSVTLKHCLVSMRFTWNIQNYTLGENSQRLIAVVHRLCRWDLKYSLIQRI